MLRVVLAVADEDGDSLVGLQRGHVAAERAPALELCQHLRYLLLGDCIDGSGREGEGAGTSHDGGAAIERDDVAGFAVDENEVGDAFHFVHG